MFGRRKVAALAAEFLATGVLTLVVLSVQRSTLGVTYFVALAAGLVTVMAYLAFAAVSGAHANPAITLAMWTARKIGALTAALYIVVQLLGAWAAYGLYTYFVSTSLQSAGAPYNAKLMVAEAIGMLVLAIGWGVVAFRRNLTIGTRAAVLGIAYVLAVVIAADTSAGSAIAGIVNPAVALGTRSWEVFGELGWLNYVLGPVLGAVIGVNLYGLLFAPAAQEDDEAVVIEEVVVAESAVAAPVATTAASTVARKKPGRKPGSTTAAKRTTTTRKTTATRASKPAAKRSTTRKK